MQRNAFHEIWTLLSRIVLRGIGVCDCSRVQGTPFCVYNQDIPKDHSQKIYILIPQVENSVRELAIQCGEPIYNLKEEGIEELKTMHAILELEGVKESLDDDFLLALKTIFCSKFGFNMRNSIAHGLFSDNQFQSYNALYTWWFILKMCYMFCGELRIKNSVKVNDKLKRLFEENNK